MAKVLDVRALREAVTALLNHVIDDLGIKELPIEDDADFYWEVLGADLFKVHEDQPKLAVGRLSDDWEFLEPTATSKEDAVSYTLVHAAPLLRYLGEKVGQ